MNERYQVGESYRDDLANFLVQVLDTNQEKIEEVDDIVCLCFTIKEADRICKRLNDTRYER